jgi:thiamine biosynthesis protein ThiS
MHITVNGKPREITAPASVTDLLAQLDLHPQAVVVELNRKIIRRPELADTSLSDGDVVELVHFVGGG